MRRDNEAALYSPCACHSLNLCGSHAAQCCSEVITFFGMVQKLYVFFSKVPLSQEDNKRQQVHYLAVPNVGKSCRNNLEVPYTVCQERDGRNALLQSDQSQLTAI